MAVYTVHTPPTAAGEAPAPEKIVFLRDGFSVWAFIFGPFWLAFHRAILPAIGWTLLIAAVAFAGWRLHLPADLTSMLSLGLGAILGFEGERLVAWSLARRGFSESAVVIGDDADEAEEVYFHNQRLARQAHVATASGERPD